MRDLTPSLHSSTSLCDALDRVLDTGVVALGELTLSVADVDLLYLGLQLVVTSMEKGVEPDLPESGPISRRVRGGSPDAGSRDDASNRPPGNGTDRSFVPPDRKEAAPPAHRCSGAAPGSPGQPPARNGLGQLVLALVNLLHELLKRQALRRMEKGGLSVIEMENLGLTLMRQAREIERLARDLGLEMADLNLDLGPLGKLM